MTNLSGFQKPDPYMGESAIADVLEQRYPADQYVYLRQVRDAAGFDAGRTIDALAVGTWPSRGMHVIAHEIKSSRSDWQLAA